MKICKSCPHCGAVLKLDSAASGMVTCPKCSNRSHTRDMKEMPAVEYVCPSCKARLKSYVRNTDVRMRCPQCNYEALASTFDRPNQPVNIPQGGSHDGHTEINLPKGGPKPVAPVSRINDNFGTTTTILVGGNKVPVYARPLSLRLHSERGETMWYGEKELPRFVQGRQVVGRIGKGADIECPTRDLYFSRMHFAVDVDYIARSGSYRHMLCYNGSQNTIFLKPNGLPWVEVKDGDMPILNVGDLIRVGHTVLEVFYDTAVKR